MEGSPPGAAGRRPDPPGTSFSVCFPIYLGRLDEFSSFLLANVY